MFKIIFSICFNKFTIGHKEQIVVDEPYGKTCKGASVISWGIRDLEEEVALKHG